MDPEERGMFKERILPGEVTLEQLQRGEYRVIESWADAGLQIRAVEVAQGNSPPADVSFDRCVDLLLVHREPKKLEKRIRFFENGSVEVHLSWNPEGLPSDAWFTTEISLAGPASITSEPPTQEWRFPITTYSKSEKGFDATDQGESVLLRWPAREGRAVVRLVGL